MRSCSREQGERRGRFRFQRVETFYVPLGCMLTELAVGLGPPSAPGAAAPFAPKPRDKYFTHGRIWIPRCPGHQAGTLSWQRTARRLAERHGAATRLGQRYWLTVMKQERSFLLSAPQRNAIGRGARASRERRWGAQASRLWRPASRRAHRASVYARVRSRSPNDARSSRRDAGNDWRDACTPQRRGRSASEIAAILIQTFLKFRA